ncbi:unnamed protein product [marine sediment metagenome]|uniref:Uncharacterized protein n=1 Tax=marine sediment metagenome TaxID=412755 RepID=X1MII5_9ZZZZ
MTSWAKTIGTTIDIRTISADPARLSFAVFNKHATATLYIKEGREVSAENGIPVYAKGNVSLSYIEDGETVREVWSMVSDTVDTPMVVFEGSK